MYILRVIACLEYMGFGMQGSVVILKHRVTEAGCVTAQSIFVP